MKYCSNCGQIMNDNANFCERCGTQSGSAGRRYEERRSEPMLRAEDGWWGSYYWLDIKTATQLLSAAMIGMGVVMLLGFGVLQSNNFLGEFDMLWILISVGMLCFGAAGLIITIYKEKEKGPRRL